MAEIITSNLSDCVDVEYELYDTNEIQSDLHELAEKHARLNTEAFKLENPTTLKDAEQNLSLATLYIKARIANVAIGFATYESITTPNGIAIYQSRGITSEAQGLQLGRTFVKIAAKYTDAKYLVAKAQNPISIWSTMQSDMLEKVYPIDALFSESMEMTEVLKSTVETRGKSGKVNLGTGLLKNSYRMGKLGDYATKNNHTGIMQIQRRLAEIGLRIHDGDAIYYGGKLLHEQSNV